MRNMMKTGFTLVELMVVIVIMGILAAIGVPKLAGSIAKAKASEVAPAANSYVKLQNAYVTEHKKLGGWKRIGYSKPKSNNFSYTCGDVCKKTTVDALGENGLVGWEASNLVSLGDCPYGQKWTVTIAKNGTDDEGNTILDFNANVSHEACVALSGDWGTVRGSENMEVASKKNSQLNPLNVSLYSAKQDADGTLTLARAILSGGASNNISVVYKNSTAEKQSFSDLYKVNGYVLNDGVNGKAVDTWLRSQLSEDAVSRVQYFYSKVITVLGDEANKTELVVGQTYKGTQSLYYGGDINGVEAVNLYGTRVVYGHVTKVDASGKYTIEYYKDEALTQKIDINSDTDFEKYEQEIKDPMLAKWEYDSPLSVSHVENNALSSLICSGKNSYNSKAGFADAGVEGYVMVASATVYTAKSKDDEGNQLYKVDENGEYVLDAKGNKIELTHVEDYAVNAWLKSQLPAGTNTSSVKVVSEIRTKDESLSLGSLYAVTQSLFYGSAKDGNVFATRPVYALVTNIDANGFPTVKYYSDKECTHQIDDKTSTDGWTLIN